MIYERFQVCKRLAKSYNSGYLPMGTHLNTDLPVSERAAMFERPMVIGETVPNCFSNLQDTASHRVALSRKFNISTKG
jgi:hypothetical protein